MAVEELAGEVAAKMTTKMTAGVAAGVTAKVFAGVAFEVTFCSHQLTLTLQAPLLALQVAVEATAEVGVIV